MNSFFPDFDGIDKRNAEWRAYAKVTFMPGIDLADLKAGQKVTVSPNLQYRDMSYSRELLTVVAVNAIHVQVRRRHGGPVILSAHEHHFYSADGFEGEAEQ